MRKSLVILLLMAFSMPETTEASLPTSSGTAQMTENIAFAASPGFGGQKAQNKRNRRTKRINRKFGVGFLPMEMEVNRG